MSVYPDREIQRQVWEGKIPIQLDLDPNESVIKNDPEAHFIMVSRCSYLHLLASVIRKHFEKFIHFIGDDSEIWFEHEGIPLKWYYPIGLLFDINSNELPWKLTVHFENYPSSIVKLGLERPEDFFMSFIKQADYLRFGNNYRVNKLTKPQQSQLWIGLWSNDFQKYWKVGQDLIEIKDSVFKNVPFRIYLTDGTLIQEPFPPNKNDGTLNTLEDLLNQTIPPSIQCLGDKSEWKVILHGIEVPKTTPLVWLSFNMSYPDNFLHLFVK